MSLTRLQEIDKEREEIAIEVLLDQMPLTVSLNSNVPGSEAYVRANMTLHSDGTWEWA